MSKTHTFKKGQHVTIETAPGSRRRIYNGERGVIARISKYKEESDAPYIVELTARRSVFVGFAAGELVANNAKEIKDEQ